jgi:transcriptional regulator with XRE-family HTH domain
MPENFQGLPMRIARPVAAAKLGRMGWREKLRLARERRGLSQSEFARRLGLKPQSVNGWEDAGPRGTTPRLDLALEAARLLEIDMGWWFGDVPDDLAPERDRLLRDAFAIALRKLGPDGLLELLISGERPAAREPAAQAATRRYVQERELVLPDEAHRHHKPRADRDRPEVRPPGVGQPPPATPRRPDERDLDQPAARERDRPRPRKPKR